MVDAVGIRWTVTGTEGQIVLTTPEGQWQMETPGVSLRVKVGKEAVETVALDGNDGMLVESVSDVGKDTARI